MHEAGKAHRLRAEGRALKTAGAEIFNKDGFDLRMLSHENTDIGFQEHLEGLGLARTGLRAER